MSARLKLPGPPRLVGREAELRAIAATLDAAAEGRGAALLLCGQAGIGKTQLLEGGCARGAERGMTVLRAYASEAERSFAFGVCRQLFEPPLARLDGERRRAALEGAAELAGDLLARGPAAAVPRSSFATFHGLYWLASNLSQQSPVLIAVDDLPSCDELSRRFLAVLVRRLAGLRIAVLAAARSEASKAEPAAVTELLSTEAVTAVEVPKLDELVSRQLARELLEKAGDDSAAAIARAGGGNPLYLREIALAFREAREEGGKPLNPERIADLGPRIVARTAALRLGRCGSDAIGLGRALAVLGEAAPLEPALRLAGLSGERGEEAVAALVGAGVLTDPRRARFSHPLVRAAVYEDLSAARRGALHRRAAELLEGEGGSVEAVAAQLMQAPPEARGATVRTLRSAARIALRQGASGSATAYLRRALAEPPGAVRGEVLLALGEAELATDPEAAIGHLAEALELAESPAKRGEAAQALARVQAARGLRREAAATIERALAEPGEVDEERFARLLADCVAMGAFEAGLRRRTLDQVDGWLRDHPSGATPAERALLAQAALRSAQEARQVGDTVALAQRAWGQGALLADEGPDGPSWLLLIWALLLAQDLPWAEEILGTVIEESRRSGSLMAFATASYFRAETRLRLGRLVESQADCEAALATRDAGWERFLAAANAARARVLIERGLIAEAEAGLGEIDDATLVGTMELSWVLVARARLAMAQRRSAAALELALKAGKLLSDEFSVRHTVLPWRPLAALAAIERGQPALAAELAGEQEAIASLADLPTSSGYALRIRGRLESGKRGLELLEAAAASFEQGSATLERAAALADVGAALRRAGQRVKSREVLRQALDLAHGCDARLLGASIREELAASGARLRREVVSGVDSLTPSERRVAGLAADGMTNSEIAQSLFVTIKTVEFHLANAYRKLEIRSRAGLAEALAGNAASGA